MIGEERRYRMGKLQKVNLYNRHFANINEDLLLKLEIKKEYSTIPDYIRKKARQDFHIVISSPEDVDRLEQMILKNNYKNNSDWLREKIRNDIKAKTYRFALDELLCLDDIVTEADKMNAIQEGYNIPFTRDEFKGRFPKLDTSKVFFDNTILRHIVYYDEEKFAMVEIMGGWIPGEEKTVDNYKILSPIEDSSEYILSAIKDIHRYFLNGEYEIFTFQNMSFYRNEILDKIIEKTDDTALKSRLKKCKQFID